MEAIVWFQKITIPPPWRELEIPKGRGGGQRRGKFQRGGGLYDWITFQRSFDSYGFECRSSCSKILSYLLRRSFTWKIVAWILAFDSNCVRNTFSLFKKHLGSWQMLRTCRCMEMAVITCYQSTWSHLVDHKPLETSLVCFALVFEVAVNFFREDWFLYKGRNDVTISQTWEFLTPVYFCLLVCNFAVKLAFVPNLLAIVFAIKVWCQFYPRSFYQSFNGNCTTFTKGVSRVGRYFDKLPFYLFF